MVTVTGRNPIASSAHCKTYSQYEGRANRVTYLNCPSGTHMTGGGMKNHVRHFNKLSGFEDSAPHGNGWRCDSGFGPGKNHCYVRCCK